MSHRTIVDYRCVTEQGWRVDWEKHWRYCRDKGWTRTLTDEEGSDPVVTLRDDADCLSYMGDLPVDHRRILIELQKIGWVRGWLHN